MNEERFKRGLRLLADEARPGQDGVERLVAKRRGREVRRRAAGGLATAAVVAALTLVTVQIMPGDDVPPPPFASGDPSPTVEPRARAEQIAYAHGGDIYLHDVGGQTRRVTDDDVFDTFPRLHGSERLRWVSNADGRSTVWELDLATGERRALVEVEGQVQGFDASETLPRLALLVSVREQQGVYVVDTSGPAFEQAPDAAARWETARRLWSFPSYLGRGGSGEDEIAVRWSPGGTKLLVVNTAVDTARERADETLLVLDAAGGAVIEPLNGTFGRWIDEDRILYRALVEDTWHVLDLATGESRRLASLPAQGAEPAISPDGRLVAMHDLRAAPALPRLYVGELHGEGAVLAATFEGVTPVWLDDQTLIATSVEACGGDCLEHWQRTDGTFRVTLDDEQRSPYVISAAFHEVDVRYAMTPGGSK